MGNDTPKYELVIRETEKEFREIVAAAHVPVTFEREVGFALQLLREKDFLANTALANPASLRDAVLNAARTGLTLDPSRKLAYLIPRNKAVVFQPSYMGKIAQAVMTGAIKSAHVDLVKEADVFEYEEQSTGPYLLHKRPRLGTDRGELQGGYCRATLGDGSVIVTVVEREKLERMRDCSDSVKAQKAKRAQGQSAGKSPYDDWSDDMYLAKIVNVAEKFWPKVLDSQVTPASAVDPDNEGGFDSARNVTPETDDEATGEAVVCISEEQIAELTAKADELATLNPERKVTLRGKITTVGRSAATLIHQVCEDNAIGCIEDLPADAFDRVMARLDDYQIAVLRNKGQAA